MKSLIKKDFRNNLVPIIGSALGLAIPYTIVICAWFLTAESTRRHLNENLFSASIIGIWVTAVLASVYGGVAFAHERHERFADFLAMMPATRSQIVLSKVIVALSCLVTMVLLNIMVFCVEWNGNRYFFHDLLIALAPVTMMFGVAWFFSSFLDSPAIASAIGIGLTFACFMIVGLITANVSSANPHDVIFAVAVTMAENAIGLAGFIGGTMIYMRRIAP
jgi:ABC-type transport system involved in multi-copper enzyme maturation permease subunit